VCSGLVNNAHHSGLTNVTVTEDKCECSYQVNYLSHFLLTLLLLPCLVRGRSAAAPEDAASIVHGAGPTRALHFMHSSCTVPRPLAFVTACGPFGSDQEQAWGLTVHHSL
jgi:hypothetical protein